MSIWWRSGNGHIGQCKWSASAREFLGPILYLYMEDIPKCDGVTAATFVDDTAVLATDYNVETAAVYR